MIQRQTNFVALDAGDDLTLYFYDEIGGFGVWAEDVALALRSRNKIARLSMRFHSPGGDMQEAAAISAVIRSGVASGKIGEVVSMVDGRAYSAATYVAMASSRVVSSPLGMWMVHRPQATQGGNADQLREHAKALDGLESSLVEAYMAKTGKNRETVQAWVSGEGSADGTIFGAQAALDAGFVDEISEHAPDMVETENAFDARFQGAAQKGAPRNGFINFFCRVPGTQQKKFGNQDRHKSILPYPTPTLKPAEGVGEREQGDETSAEPPGYEQARADIAVVTSN